MLIQTMKLLSQRDDVELTAFLHKPDPFLKADEKRPAVLVCPGGAYATCDRHSYEGDPVAMSFAADGYQAFVLEYSVTSRAKAGETLYPAMLLDYGKAIMTIREHAEEWNVDVTKVALIGFSAGGHLAGTVATQWNSGLLEEHFHTPSVAFKPLCAMLIYPVADFVTQELFRKEKGNPNFSTVNMNYAWFGAEEPGQEALENASPARTVTRNCPPVFLAAARDDGLVDPMCSLNMAISLQKAGIPYELHLYELGDHGFALGRNLLQPWREDKRYTASAWVDAAKLFLLHQIAPETAQYERNIFAQLEN